VPETSVNPQDSPYEGSTSIAPVTSQTAGEAASPALESAKSEYSQEGNDDDKSSLLTLITPSSTLPVPNPTSSNHFIIMQRNECRCDICSRPNHSKPTLRTCMGTRYLEPQPAQLESVFQQTKQSFFDSVRVAMPKEISISLASASLSRKQISDKITKRATYPIDY
jgi:hypothetical protein